MKVENVLWFNSMNGTIGIVLADNGHKKKAYIKNVIGLNEENDIKEILESGAKIHISQAESIVNHLTK